MKYKATYRYCIQCREIQRFELNKVLNHSECTECGSRYGKKKVEEIESILKKKHNKIVTNANIWLAKQLNLLKKVNND